MNPRALPALLFLLSIAPLAAAQGMTHAGPGSMPAAAMHSATMTGSAMSGRPTLHFTTRPGMNMTMGRSGDLNIMAAPGMGRYSYRMNGHTGTVTYASRNARALFGHYDRAVRARGWREDMNRPMGMMGAGHYAETYVMGGHRLDLSAVTTGATTTVTFTTR